jgi:hypothetical protein
MAAKLPSQSEITKPALTHGTSGILWAVLCSAKDRANPIQDPVRIATFKSIYSSAWRRLLPSCPTDPLTGAVVSDFDELVSKTRPHGDIDFSFHRLGQGRIIRNARGHDNHDNLCLCVALPDETKP